MTDAYMRSYRTLDKGKLLPKRAVLDFMSENGAHAPSLAALSSQYEDAFGIDPIWHYYLSDGWHTGVFIVPVQEGFLLIPYDEVDSEVYEILLPDAAWMLDSDCCTRLKMEMREYADAICAVLESISEEIHKRL